MYRKANIEVQHYEILGKMAGMAVEVRAVPKKDCRITIALIHTTTTIRANATNDNNNINNIPTPIERAALVSYQTKSVPK